MTDHPDDITFPEAAAAAQQPEPTGSGATVEAGGIAYVRIPDIEPSPDDEPLFHALWRFANSAWVSPSNR